MKKKTISKTRQKQATASLEATIKKHETFELNLTKFELLHLRDLMGILLPPDGSQTVSESLAASEDRSLIESMLWDKLCKLCKQAKLPLEEEAPDYIVAPVSAPPMGVFQVNQDLQSSKRSPKSGFLPEDEDSDNEETEQVEE